MHSGDIDWSGIRAAAVALGNVLDAARRAAAVLPTQDQPAMVERIRKRAHREGWMDAAAAAKSSPHTTIDADTGSIVQKAMSQNVPTGAEIVSQSLAEDSRETRISLSKAARRMAKQAEDAPLEQAGDALQAGKLAALTHGWAETADTRAVSIQVLTQISIDKQ